ncbi:MAG: heme-binding protein [Acidobacteria bacterium]|nr:heme-binding protein [Acidobacteriota bacterium]
MKTITTFFLAAVAALGAEMTVMSKRTLTLEGARMAMDAVIAEAKKNNAGGVVAVVDDGGNLMALNRIDGTFAAGANVAIGKARTAALFQKPTKFFEEVIGKGRTSMVALNDFTPLQGGVPILIDGQIVGAVGVSGANSAAQDEEFARSGVAAVMNKLQAKVTFFEAETVKAGFDKGAVLFDGSDKYMVHASRREKPGEVEVHHRDADIVYVLNGTAKLVTGGELRDGKTTAPGEVRGTQLEGGEERQLKPGDAIIIPANVPHWFKEVSEPFQYYVVKVR